MDILNDMGVSKLLAKVFFKRELLLLTFLKCERPKSANLFFVVVTGLDGTGMF